MRTAFAFECFADQDLFLVLRDACGLPLDKRHSYSQGEVVNDVLVHGYARIGLVDEDPGRSHHRRRDSMAVVRRTDDVEHRSSGGRHLIVVRPDLEQCFLRGMVAAGVQLPSQLANLERRLADSDPRRSAHVAFREELESLRERRGSFVAEIERIVRSILEQR